MIAKMNRTRAVFGFGLAAFLVSCYLALYLSDTPVPQWSVGDYFTPPSSSPVQETVVFSLLSYGETSASEYSVAIKSILMHASTPIDIHFITDEDGRAHYTRILSLVERPFHNVRVYFYLISKKAMELRANRFGEGRPDVPLYGAMRSNHWGGMPGLMKMYMHEILPLDVKQSIFIDSDALFTSDPLIMWRQFDTWAPTAGIAIPEHNNSEQPTVNPHWRGASRICSCVLMYRHDVLRAARYIDSNIFPASDPVKSTSREALRAIWGEPDHKDGYYTLVGLGDQGYLYSFMKYTPELHAHLPLSFEVTACLFDHYGLTMHTDDQLTIEQQLKTQVNLKNTPDDGTLIVPNVLHFNCVGFDPYYNAPQFTNESNWYYWKSPFRDTVNYHANYKWIWLNRGNGSATIEYHTVEDLRFLDERMAGHTEAAGYPPKEVPLITG